MNLPKALDQWNLIAERTRLRLSDGAYGGDGRCSVALTSLLLHLIQDCDPVFCELQPSVSIQPAGADVLCTAPSGQHQGVWANTSGAFQRT